MSQTSSSFIPQFLSKNIWSVLGMTALFHILAAVVLHSFVSAIVLGVVGIAVAFMTWKRLEWGVALALFEIVVGAHGHLIAYTAFGLPISLRMVVFVAVMGGWFLGLLQKKWAIRFVPARDIPFLALFIAVAYGIVRGLALQQGIAGLIDDANSYITLVYLLPLASVIWTQENRRLFLTTLFTGTLWVSLFTFALTFIFTHISQSNIWAMYVLVRDTRMFEVTLLSSPGWLAHAFLGGSWYFRVFSQAQLFAPLFLLILASAIFFLHVGKKERVPLWTWIWCMCFFGAFLQSLSRSFVVGFVAGVCTLFGFWLLGGKESWKTWGVVARRKAALLGSMCVAVLTLWVLISFPVPARPNLTSSPFYRGDEDNTRELAVSSRWNMLSPLLNALAESPMLGQGFGKELTYISDDPRIREMTGGTGEITTYRFEWGFLDIWLKMGIFGMFAYLWIAMTLIFQVIENIRAQGKWSFAAVRERWLEVGMVSGVGMIFAVHVFTPYLNHPTGLFFLLLTAYMVSWKGSHGQKKEEQPLREGLRIFEKTVSLGASVRTKV